MSGVQQNRTIRSLLTAAEGLWLSLSLFIVGEDVDMVDYFTRSDLDGVLK